MSCGCNKINKRSCTCTTPCGCEDRPKEICSPCVTPPCVNGDTCPETFSAACVVYTGDTVLDSSGNVLINKGDRMDKLIQRVFLMATNSGCAYPTAPCQSVIGVQSGVITAATIALSWQSVVVATSYQVEYKVAGASSWTLNPAVTVTNDLIGNLTANTIYNIRVKAICSSGSCESLTIQVKTLAS